MSEREEMEEALALARDVTRAQRIEEARLRLTCAALTTFCDRGHTTSGEDATDAVAAADACLSLLYPEAPR